MLMVDEWQLNEKVINQMEYDRESLGYTQKQWANMLGVSLSGYKKIIRHETKGIKMTTIAKLDEITHKLHWEGILLGDEEEKLAMKIDAMSDWEVRLRYYNVCCYLIEDYRKTHDVV